MILWLDAQDENKYFQYTSGNYINKWLSRNDTNTFFENNEPDTLLHPRLVKQTNPDINVIEFYNNIDNQKAYLENRPTHSRMNHDLR